MIPLNNPVKDNERKFQKRPQKKITPQRLKNIALYYLKRFESSTEKLRNVLQKRVTSYKRENPDFDVETAGQWIEEILQELHRLHYLDDARYAEIKIRNYLSAGKPERYIQNKLREKGISEQQINEILATQEYNPHEMALRLAQRKKIGPFRPTEQRRDFRQKDMGTLIRAGFDYDVVCEVLNMQLEEQ